MLDQDLSAEAKAAIRNKLNEAASIIESIFQEVKRGAISLEVAARKLELEAVIWAHNYRSEILHQWSLKGLPPPQFQTLVEMTADEVANYAADHFCVDCTPDSTTEFTPLIIGLHPGVIATSAAPNIGTRGRIYQRLREALQSYPDQYRRENQFRYTATVLP